MVALQMCLLTQMLYTFREMYPLILSKKVENMNLITARGEMDTSLSEIQS